MKIIKIFILKLFIIIIVLLSGPAAQIIFADGAASPDYFPDGFPSPGSGHIKSLDEVLASEDFGSTKEGWRIRLKPSGRQGGLPDFSFAPWAEKIRHALGLALRLIAILAIATFVFFTVLFFWKKLGPLAFRQPWSAGPEAQAKLPQATPEAGPLALFSMAESFFAQGNLREAWAACLSGCLGAFAQYRLLSFPAGATEYGCLALVRKAHPAMAHGFEELVGNWVLFAYGGRPPAEGTFAKAIAYGRSLLQAEQVPGKNHEP